MVAIATSLMPEKQFVSYQEIDDLDEDVHATLITDENEEKYLLRAPGSAQNIAKFTAETEITKALDAKIAQNKIQLHFSLPKIVASNQNMTVVKPYTGRAFTPSALSENQVLSLAKALARVHSMPFSVIQQTDLPEFTNQETQKMLINTLDEAALLGKIPSSLLERFEEFLNNEVFWSYDSTVIHGNFRPNFVLFSNEEVTQILSWSGLQIGDSAYDLAGITPALTVANCSVFFEAYHKLRSKLNKNLRFDPNLEKRAEFYSQFELVQKLLTASSAKDHDLMNDLSKELVALAEKIRLGEALDEAEERARKEAEALRLREEKIKLQDTLHTKKFLRSDIIEIQEKPKESTASESIASLERELEGMLDQKTVQLPVGPRATDEAPVIHPIGEVSSASTPTTLVGSKALAKSAENAPVNTTEGAPSNTSDLSVPFRLEDYLESGDQ
jgi:hypothetical protein